MATNNNSFSLQGVEKRALDARMFGTKEDLGTGLAPGVEQRARTNLLKLGPPDPNMIVNGGRPYAAPGEAKMFAPVVAAPAAPMSPAPGVGPAGASPAPMKQGPPPEMVMTGRGAPPPFSGPNSLSRGAAPGSASGLGGPVPVGRSRFDPQRMAEQMIRRKDPRGAAFIFDRANAQDAPMFQEQMEDRRDVRSDLREQNRAVEAERMFGRQEAATDAREERGVARDEVRFERETQRRLNESEVDYQRRVELIKREEEARGDPTKVTTIAIPGTEYVIPFSGKRSMGTLPTVRPQPSVPAGMVPVAAERNGVRFQAPKEAQAEPPPVKEFKKPGGETEYRQWNPERRGWELVSFIDTDGDGVPDSPADAAPAEGAAPAKPLPTAGGNQFRVKQ